MSHSDAKMFRDTIRDIVRDEIAQLSPAERYAQVVRFVPGSRRVVVRYNGEPEGNEVTLPYNTAAPSHVGQWVRVGGPASDRHVVDLLGASEPERRIQEMGREAYVPPKWIAMDMRLVTTFPMNMFLEDGETMRLGTRTLYGTMMRIPWDISVSQMMCYVAFVHNASGTAPMKLALYDVTDGYNMELIRQASFRRGTAPTEYRQDFDDGRADLRRGQQVVAAVWNESTVTEISVPIVITRPERTFDSADFLSFSIPDVTSLPQSISRASLPPDRVRKDAMLHLSLLDARGAG